MFLEDKTTFAPAVDNAGWRAVYRRAAAHIEKYGWFQGSPGEWCSRRCAAIAIRRELDDRSDALNDIGGPLIRYLGVINITEWNDAPERTKEQVIFALRDCADNFTP